MKPHVPGHFKQPRNLLVWIPLGVSSVFCVANLRENLGMALSGLAVGAALAYFGDYFGTPRVRAWRLYQEYLALPERDSDEALEYLQGAFNEASLDILRVPLVRMLLKRGMYHEAFPLVENFSSESLGDFEKRHMKVFEGKVLWEIGQTERALGIVEAVLAGTPSFKPALELREYMLSAAQDARKVA
ncbi:MAG: hypothetical protein JST16_08140 [Bdellovibrionales bacterium]|nr:hypothetical protein [Bdellovibrionales bacterium]